MLKHLVNTMNDANCIAVKDAILQALNEENTPKLLKNMEEIIEALDLVQPWTALRYNYKAAEVAERIIVECNRISETTTNWKRQSRLDVLRVEAQRISAVHHEKQQECFARY